MREVILYSVLFGLSTACLSGFGGGGGCCSAPTASCGNPCGSYASGAAATVDRYPLAPPSPLSVPLPGPIQSIPSNAYAVAPQQPGPVNQGGLFQDPTSFFGRPLPQMPIIPMPQIQPIPLYGHPTNDANSNYAPPTQQFVPASQSQNIQPEQIYRGSGGYSTGPATAVETSGLGYKNAGSATAIVVEGQYKETRVVPSLAEPSQTVVKVGTEIDTTVGGSDYSDVLEHKKQIQVIQENEKKVKQNIKPIQKPVEVDENPDAGSSIDSTDGGSDYDQVEEGEVAGNGPPTVPQEIQQKIPSGGADHASIPFVPSTVQVIPSGPVPQPPPVIISKHVAPVHKPSIHGDSRQIPDDEEESIAPKPAIVKIVSPTAGGLDFKEVQHDFTTEKPKSTIPGKIQTQPTSTSAPASSDFEEASPEQPETPAGGTEIRTSNTVIQPSKAAPAEISHSNEEQGDGTDYDDNEASLGPLPTNDVTSSGSGSASSATGDKQVPAGTISDSASGTTGSGQIPLAPAEEVKEEGDEPEQNLASNEADDISQPNEGNVAPAHNGNVNQVTPVTPRQSSDEEEALADAISSEAVGHPTTSGAANTGSSTHVIPSVAVPAHQNDKITIIEPKNPGPIAPTKPVEPSVVPSDVSEETDGSEYDTVPEDRPDVPTHPTLPKVVGKPSVKETKIVIESSVPVTQGEVPSHEERENHGETVTTVEDNNHSETGFNPKPTGSIGVHVAPSVTASKIFAYTGVPSTSHSSESSGPAPTNGGMMQIQPKPLTVSHEVKPSPAYKKEDDNQEIVVPQETQGTDYSDGAEYDEVKPNAVEHTSVIVNSEDEKKENRNELAVEYNGQRAAGTVQLTEVDPISKYTDELISLRKLKRSQRA